MMYCLTESRIKLSRVLCLNRSHTFYLFNVQFNIFILLTFKITVTHSMDQKSMRHICTSSLSLWSTVCSVQAGLYKSNYNYLKNFDQNCFLLYFLLWYILHGAFTKINSCVINEILKENIVLYSLC